MKKRLRNCILFVLSILLFVCSGAFSAADEVVFGDVDGDGELTDRDIDCIANHFSRTKMMDSAAITRADYDGDGKITENDVLMMMNALFSSEQAISAKQSFSFLVTSDLNGNAWKPATSDGRVACSALNTAACIQTLRENDPDLLLFDAGGSIFGSALSDDYEDRTGRGCGPITSLFIHAGYDGILLGDEAFTYPSGQVRKEVNNLIDKKIPVLGANLLMRNRTTFDPEGALWNALSPYLIFEIPQNEEEPPIRLLVIGMTEPDLAPSEDEILPADPVEIYQKLRRELEDQIDYTVLMYHGNVESDAMEPDSYSLRDFIKKTNNINLVLASHCKGKGVRSERNSSDKEVPIVLLDGGAEVVTKISVSLRDIGSAAILVEPIDTTAYVPDAGLEKIVKPFVSKVSGLMDTVICTVEQRFDAFDPKTLASTDAMDLTHEMQMYIAQQWIDYHDTDLPNEMISIAYPYLSVGDLKEGPLSYRDLSVIKSEQPSYSLMMVRGSEIKAWLSDYAGRIMNEETVYSLYGLSYLLNTRNTISPLGYLEHGNALPVDDADVFTLILAEKAEEDLNFQSFLDEDWLPIEDRMIKDISLPKPVSVRPMGENPVVDALTAYLEQVEILNLKHEFTWLTI